MSDDYRCESTTATGARCRNRALDGWCMCWAHADVVVRATSIVWAEQAKIEAEAELAGYPFWRLKEFLQ